MVCSLKVRSRAKVTTGFEREEWRGLGWEDGEGAVCLVPVVSQGLFCVVWEMLGNHALRLTKGQKKQQRTNSSRLFPGSSLRASLLSGSRLGLVWPAG